mmetsp:Transcript_21694/g.26738  ORF Transcript_21694/g.26738 Transcript_21694/m.26738 type:complete len:418 (-) Transcript_21694:54-1307(-)
MLYLFAIGSLFLMVSAGDNDCEDQREFVCYQYRELCTAPNRCQRNTLGLSSLFHAQRSRFSNLYHDEPLVLESELNDYERSSGAADLKNSEIGSQSDLSNNLEMRADLCKFMQEKAVIDQDIIDPKIISDLCDGAVVLQRKRRSNVFGGRGYIGGQYGHGFGSRGRLYGRYGSFDVFGLRPAGSRSFYARRFGNPGLFYSRRFGYRPRFFIGYGRNAANPNSNMCDLYDAISFVFIRFCPKTCNQCDLVDNSPDNQETSTVPTSMTSVPTTLPAPTKCSVTQASLLRSIGSAEWICDIPVNMDFLGGSRVACLCHSTEGEVGTEIVGTGPIPLTVNLDSVGELVNDQVRVHKAFENLKDFVNRNELDEGITVQCDAAKDELIIEVPYELPKSLKLYGTVGSSTTQVMTCKSETLEYN